MKQIIDPEEFFDKGIFDLLEIKDLSEEQKNKITRDMMTTINNRVLARVLDLLQEKGVKEQFESLLEINSQEKIEDFLTEHQIDLKGIAVEESLLYKMEIVGSLKQ